MKTKNSCSKTFNSHLAAYSATATAALLAAPATADATIQNITGLSVSLSLSLNAGLQEMSFSAGPFHGNLSGARYYVTFASTTRGGAFGHGHFSEGRARISGNLAFSNSPNSYNAARIQSKYPIAGRSFTPTFMQLGSRSIRFSSGRTHRFVSGNFVPPANGATTGYVGFKANQNGQTYYGWLRVKVAGDANGIPDQISLVAKDGDGIFGAFDNAIDISSDNFTAGAIAVPEPSIKAIGGLSLLALGALGVREMRRRRKLNSAKA